MNSRTQALVLLLFGAALLRITSGNALLRFVRPVARPSIFLAGAAIVVLALWTLVAGPRLHDDRDHDDDHDHDHDRDHDDDRDHDHERAHVHHGAPRATWLITAPILVLLVIAPAALGTFSAARVPAAVPKPSGDHFPALVGHDPVSLSLSDFATRAIWDGGRTLASRQVRVTGFVLRAAPGGFVLSRLAITCCAADARPIDIGVRTLGSIPARGSWVTVTGSYAGVSVTDASQAEIQASSTNAVKPPGNPYDD
jgi:uncharacterized repeat protein (TIGR03943 family)